MTDRLIPKIPKVLSHYRLGPLLGQGGMGMVFEATDRRDRSRVALKLLHHHLAQDRNFQDRFKREAHVAALLRSPYTVHLLDYGFAQDHYFLVMEFIEGHTLKDELEKGPLQPARALGICVQVSRALEEAQARGVVHRDIKPENVMLQPGDSVKVTDFGIARQLSGGTLTMTGGFLGTMAYAAPEQAMGRSDHRSDLYALGATLYHALAGRPPYLGGVLELIGQAEQIFPDGPLRERGLPEQVIDITRKALQRNPDDRYNTASEMAGAMDRAQNAVGTAPMADAAPPVPAAAAPTAIPPVPPGEVTELHTPAGPQAIPTPAPETEIAAAAAASAGAALDTTGIVSPTEATPETITPAEPTFAPTVGSPPPSTAPDATELAGVSGPPTTDSPTTTPARAADPFAAATPPAPPPVAPPATREWTAQPAAGGGGPSPVVMVLGALGVLAVLGIGAFILTQGGGDDGGGDGGPPANDAFDDARSISSLPFRHELDSSGATLESADDVADECAGDEAVSTVWYEYEADATEEVTVSTAGSDYDTRVAVFADRDDELEEVACDDDSGGNPSFSSLASFHTAEGETYFIFVAGEGEGGGLLLAVSGEAGGFETPTGTSEEETPTETETPEETETPGPVGPRPPNDESDAPTNIATLPFTTDLDTTGATTSDTDPIVSTCGFGQNSHSVWYLIDQQADPVTIPTTISTAGSDYDTVVAVYDFTDGFVQLDCNDDVVLGDPSSLVSFTAENGRRYLVEIMAYGDSGAGGNLHLSMDVQNIDDIDNPAEIGFVPFSTLLNVNPTTTAPDDPVISCGAQQHSKTVWFLLFAPTFSGRLFVDTTGSTYDTVVAVWTGTRGSLVEVACNDDVVVGTPTSYVEWDVVAGTTYYISVGAFGLNAESGILQFRLDFVP
ncbi:MAG: serine/threonine-protein kinase [Dehalococcoidia bacterium]